MPDRNLAARRLLAVTEEELQRIVLDIHDGPVQNLFAALSQLTLLQGQLAVIPRLPAECVATTSRAIGLLEVSLSDIRDLIGAFRAPEFANSGLDKIVEDIVIQHEALTSSVVSLEIKKPIPKDVSLSVKIVLCRTLQEALSNVRRHSGVNTAAVKLWMEKKHLVIEITDSGRGFAPPPVDDPQVTELHKQIGLRGMRERAELVGGKLFIESRSGKGTLIRVEAPIHGE